VRTPKPKGWRRWANVAAFVDDASLRHPVGLLWSALAATSIMPLAMLWCMWIGVGTWDEFQHDVPLALVLAEPLLLAGLVAWDMRRPREGTRRFLLAVGVANAGFGILFGALYGNVVLCPVAAGCGAALAVFVAGKEPRRLALTLGWTTLLVACLLPAMVLGYGRTMAAMVADSWLDLDYQVVGKRVEAAWPFLHMKGASDAELTVFALRAAEACQRSGDFDGAHHWVERASESAKWIPIPGANQGIGLGDTLAWRASRQAIPSLALAAYAGRAWGNDLGWGFKEPDNNVHLRPDALVGVRVTDFDRLGWAWELLK
jgi:hypothetical protein